MDLMEALNVGARTMWCSMSSVVIIVIGIITQGYVLDYLVSLLTLVQSFTQSVIPYNSLAKALWTDDSHEQSNSISVNLF